MTRPFYAPLAAAVPIRCKTFRIGPNGLEKRCSACRDWWPADTDFFTRHEVRPGGLANQCKACASDSQAGSRGHGARSTTPAPMQLLASISWLGTQRRSTTSVGKNS